MSSKLVVKSLNTDAQVAFGIFESKDIADMTLAKTSSEIHDFDMHKFIAARGVTCLTTRNPSDCVELNAVSVPISQDKFEPSRRLNDFSPPTHFYRRFWRSESGGILSIVKHTEGEM